MFAGEEVFRDKKGVHNSYKSPDDINAIDWNMKHENRELFDYYRELIRLRRSHPAFRMTSADDVVRLEYGILQAARLRMSKTEFISCPSCGRTLFDERVLIPTVKKFYDFLVATLEQTPKK